ncbi:MAG: hypothetical protein KIT31_03680 [Deltaproteobacteria bacterium]|nr:hypothetical protein [Deltaproteobacteria bacterium]
MRTCLAVAIVLAACGGDEPGDAGGDDARVFCVEETNQHRTGAGRPAVARSAQLEDFAGEGAQVDHGGSPHDHFRDTSGGGIAFAENECPHWDVQRQAGGDLNELVRACIAAFVSEGPGGGHYDNLMGNYGSLGCGIFQAGSSVTIVQDYGR